MFVIPTQKTVGVGGLVKLFHDFLLVGFLTRSGPGRIVILYDFGDVVVVYKGIVGCTPANVPYWKSLYKPHIVGIYG